MNKTTPRMPDSVPDKLDRTSGGTVLAACAYCGARQAAALVIGRLRKPVCMEHYEEYWPLTIVKRGAPDGGHQSRRIETQGPNP